MELHLLSQPNPPFDLYLPSPLLKVRQHLGVTAMGGGGEAAGADGCPVPGHKFLNGEVNSAASECLNENDEHPLAHCLTQQGGYLASDCDEQLIISLSFNQVQKP